MQEHLNDLRVGGRPMTREELAQENKQLKEEIENYQKELEKADSITQSCIYNGSRESEISFRQALNKVKELQQENIKLKKENDDSIKAIIELAEEKVDLTSVLKEIKKVIDGYMPNEHAMCKAFDEIEFIIKEIIDKGIGE